MNFGRSYGISIAWAVAMFFSTGCQMPKPSAVDWHAVPGCGGCDEALGLAVEDMQVRDIRRLEQMGIPYTAESIAERRSCVNFPDAMPHRVCRDGNDWMVVFRMPTHLCVSMPANQCLGVRVKADGKTEDLDPDLKCDWYERRSDCSKVIWTMRSAQ